MVEFVLISVLLWGGKKKDKYGVSLNKLMDDYFKEEEVKLREVDNVL